MRGSTHATLGRVGNYFDEYGALARPVEFAEKNALPSAQREFSIFDEDGLAGSGQDGFHVRIAVAFRMAVGTIIRNQVIENSFDIPGNIGIRVLVDGDSGRRVRHVDTAQSAGHARLVNCVFDFAGDIHELRALAGPDAKRLHAGRITGWE
jgi:hypothetical protein